MFEWWWCWAPIHYLTVFKFITMSLSCCNISRDERAVHSGTCHHNRRESEFNTQDQLVIVGICEQLILVKDSILPLNLSIISHFDNSLRT